MLQGVLTELNKVDQLTQYDYLKTKILVPALSYARSRKLITAQRTYQIKKLVERKMLHQITPNARQYTLGFDNSYGQYLSSFTICTPLDAPQ